MGPEINKRDKVKISATGWFYGFCWSFADGQAAECGIRLPGGCAAGRSGGGRLREGPSWELSGRSGRKIRPGNCGCEMVETVALQRDIHTLTKVFLFLWAFRRERGGVFGFALVFCTRRRGRTRACCASRSLVCSAGQHSLHVRVGQEPFPQQRAFYSLPFKQRPQRVEADLSSP